MCTNAVQYLIRDGVLHACVQMRSNDAVLGYKNDRAWQHTVLSRLAHDLSLPVGDLFWSAGSLHVYERHFFLVDHYDKTGEIAITKSKYRELYPDSPYGQSKEQ
jgi:thymidylate synthase